MKDEELGQALGTALAAPEVTAAPDAGARLRARARRARTERLAAGGAVVVVLALLVAVGVVRGVGGGARSTPVASPPAGLSRLTTPLTVALAQVTPEHDGAGCGTGSGLRCVPPAAALTVDEVVGLSTSELPESGAFVQVALTATDAGTLAMMEGASLTAGVGTASYPADLPGGDVLRIRVPTPRMGQELVDELGPVRLGPPRTGPGRLGRPLQIWTVRKSDRSPCAVSPARAGVLVVNRGSECLVLTGPELTIDSADLELVPPQDIGPQRLVSVGLTGPVSDQFTRYTARHVGDRAAFVAGGHLLSSPPVLQGPISGSFEIQAPDRAGAEALVTRLRP
ncbi:MAG TPA: hypothetical protein VI357_15985 [Mycobacteriales bacterium]